MGHEVIPWLLNLAWHHFGLHRGKNVSVTMEFEIPKRCIFKAYIIHRHGLTCLWRRHIRGALAKNARAYGREIIL
jgi:hypothetical protein